MVKAISRIFTCILLSGILSACSRAVPASFYNNSKAGMTLLLTIENYQQKGFLERGESKKLFYSLDSVLLLTAKNCKATYNLKVHRAEIRKYFPDDKYEKSVLFKAQIENDFAIYIYKNDFNPPLEPSALKVHAYKMLPSNLDCNQ